MEASATIATILYMAGAMGAAAMATWIYPRRLRYGAAGAPIVLALLMSAIWAIVALTSRESGIAGALAFSATNVAWLFVTYRLFSIDGRDQSLKPIRPMAAALAFVELLHMALAALIPQLSLDAETLEAAFGVMALFRLMVAVGGLVLVHNLYLGAVPGAQALLRWPAGAIAVMWLYDLNLFTIGYLAGDIPSSLAILRGLMPLAMAALIAPGLAQTDRPLKLAPSRSIAFQSFSLLVIGAYLIAMVAIAQALAWFGGDFARTVQLTFIVAASVVALLFLPSAKLRSWLKVTLTKHLFQHRYDYREEWLRFTRTIGRSADTTASLPQRVVHAMADITDSPGGILLTPAENNGFQLAARWNWKTLDVPASAMSREEADVLLREDFVVDLDAIRAGTTQERVRPLVPHWLQEAERAWAIVPLIHFDRLTGIVVLMRPRQARQLDWEDFDLLKVAGRQLGSYLAERDGQEALAEARQFDEFNRRIAFVMHDIKNLASQLSLLARNAEKHADKPEFRKDMLVTLRNSAGKLEGLLARLGRYNAGEMTEPVAIDLEQLLQQIHDRFNPYHPVELAIADRVAAYADRHALEQVLAHLVQNAIDATGDKTPVNLRLSLESLHGVIEVIDSGSGMSPEFVRSGLFKPFVSSKPGGFGIGAYEARELVQAMRGRLEVESREELGSRFTIRLPLAEIAQLYDSYENRLAENVK